MNRLAQKAALGAYGMAQTLKVSRWPFYPRWFPPFYFAYKKYLEDPFGHLLRTYPDLLANGHVLDVGANIGYTAVLFARSLSTGYKVFAFEPEAANFRALESIIRRKDLTSTICPVHAAVGASSGTVSLSLNPVHPADHRILTTTLQQSAASQLEQSIVMISLDHYTSSMTPPPISFIKVDVQGYEYPVCEGMAGTLRQNPDAVVALEYAPTEMEQLGFNPAAILDFFDQRSYRRYLLTRQDGLREIARHDLAPLIPMKGYTDLVFSLRKLL